MLSLKGTTAEENITPAGLGQAFIPTSPLHPQMNTNIDTHSPDYMPVKHRLFADFNLHVGLKVLFNLKDMGDGFVDIWVPHHDLHSTGAMCEADTDCHSAGLSTST